MADSTQHKLSRVRPPRVQITYDVETGGAVEKRELPFIVGIMADLSGKPAEALAPVKDRKFVEIDRDNFNEVLSAATPRVTLRVPNRLVKDSDEQLGVELSFKHMDDFEPVEIMERVPQLKKLLDARKRLRDLLTKLDGNDSLDALLSSVVKSTEEQAELKKLLQPQA
ncbi:type VI secretion system contractile sheath small subunit [Niveispirillum cyanobacteriorum]|uniref:Type VI secretion system contractile sheath small subunit n=1 Tax=Niveispirillum cyanobacteriorum TaxID=1612173 RepID=A0A2K9ND57_9PROT|nr:type VI secretion system contractile sheath small subunit [Niveispirillum cyanobacteriorum]AUN31080.1 type VI secretion system contractile sheath small subunit [Niveispirillum cyanobacteriorum]GGE84376.1 type VI secretion protein [Niveispirillum cyanobacteriorum]